MTVAVSEPFANLTSGDVRLVHEASKLGAVTLHLWPDAWIGVARFPQPERTYWWESCRFVDSIRLARDPNSLDGAKPSAWVMRADHAELDVRRRWCDANGVRCIAIDPVILSQFPDPLPCPVEPQTRSKRVIVTGTFDLFHSGHVRFFEEVSALGDLYVCVGHDANIRLLKGEGRPLFPQNERAFLAGSVKFAKLALLTSGSGWMDAAPEIALLRPDIYAVNEDGDVPEKQTFCREHGIEYRVLRREPKPGLTRRSSTDLRGNLGPG